MTSRDSGVFRICTTGVGDGSSPVGSRDEEAQSGESEDEDPIEEVEAFV